MRRPPLTDALLALGLVVLAQVTVWTGDVSGPRALVALTALTMTVPLVAIEAVGAHVALRRSAAALALTLGVVVAGER
jgi:hypothetical protein